MDEIMNWFATFDFEKFTVLMTWLASSGILTWAGIIWSKYRKYKALTPTEIKDDIMSELTPLVESKIDEVITIAVDKALSPILEYLKNIEAIAKVQVESLVLSNSTDPQSKLALIENVSKVKGIKTVVIEKVKEEVKEFVAEQAAKEERKEQAIAEIENAVDYTETL
jgi:hypothetical protein